MYSGQFGLLKFQRGLCVNFTMVVYPLCLYYNGVVLALEKVRKHGSGFRERSHLRVVEDPEEIGVISFTPYSGEENAFISKAKGKLEIVFFSLFQKFASIVVVIVPTGCCDC